MLGGIHCFHLLGAPQVRGVYFIHSYCDAWESLVYMYNLQPLRFTESLVMQ